MGSMEKSSGREGVLSPGKMDSKSLVSQAEGKDPIAVEQVLLSYLQMSSSDILLLPGSWDGKSETTVR